MLSLLLLGALTGPVRAEPKEIHKNVTVDGKPHVLWQGYYENGKPWYEQTWLGDKKDGLEIQWNDKGVKTSECHWKLDALHGSCKRWHDNGKKAEESTYDHYILNGRYQSWHDTGAPMEETTYVGGLPDGDWREWHDNGAKAIEARFKMGVPIGSWKRWNAKGVEVEAVTFVKGEAVVPKATGKPADDFAFVLARGSGLEGYDTLRVAPSGRAEFLFMKHEQKVAKKAVMGLKAGEIYIDVNWYKASFRLSADELKALRAKITALKIDDLEDHYSAGVNDGTQWHLQKRDGGKVKKVYFDNKFPDPAKELAAYVDRNVLDRHALTKLGASPSHDSGHTTADTFLKD